MKRIRKLDANNHKEYNVAKWITSLDDVGRSIKLSMVTVIPI